MATIALRAFAVLGLLLTASMAVAQPADFSGTWYRYPDPNAGGVDYPPPPGGPPPFKEPYASAFKAFVRKRDDAYKQGKQLASDASALCRPEGMPTIMGATYDLEILQTGHEVVVLAEYLTQTRRIYLNEQLPPVAEITPTYNGYSVGYWDGDALVVDTVGIREDVQFMNMPRSAKMRISERIRLLSANQLEDRVTITDPVVFTRPYVFTFGYKRDRGYRIKENICDDNRYHADKQGDLILDVKPK